MYNKDIFDLCGIATGQTVDVGYGRYSSQEMTLHGTNDNGISVSVGSKDIKYAFPIAYSQLQSVKQIDSQIGSFPGIKAEPAEIIKLTPPLTLTENEYFNTALKNSSKFLSESMRLSAAKAIKEIFKNNYKIDVNPLSCYRVAFWYDDIDDAGRKLQPPYNGKLISATSLVDALIHKSVYFEFKPGELSPFTPGGPNVSFSETFQPRQNFRAFSFKDSNIEKWREQYGHYYNNTAGYVGIYTSDSTFNSSTHVNVDAISVRQALFDYDLSSVYKSSLDDFWKVYTEDYTTAVKGALINSACKQFLEGSLTDDGLLMVLSATGVNVTYWDLCNIPGWWSLLDADSFGSEQNTNVRCGLLDINCYAGTVYSGTPLSEALIGRYQCTDVIYIENDNLTLLYIPGNTSPIHMFNNTNELRNWFARSFADPAVREQIFQHYLVNDYAYHSDRIDLMPTLETLGVWPSDRDRYGQYTASYSNWDPTETIHLSSFTDVFEEVTSRSKTASYRQADKIKTHNDLIRERIGIAVSMIGDFSLLLLPLAPFSSAASGLLAVIDITLGTLALGTGISAEAEGRDGASDIVSGLLNMIPNLYTGARAGTQELHNILKIVNGQRRTFKLTYPLSKNPNFVKTAVPGESGEFYRFKHHEQQGAGPVYKSEENGKVLRKTEHCFFQKETTISTVKSGESLDIDLYTSRTVQKGDEHLTNLGGGIFQHTNGSQFIEFNNGLTELYSEAGCRFIKPREGYAGRQWVTQDGNGAWFTLRLRLDGGNPHQSGSLQNRWTCGFHKVTTVEQLTPAAVKNKWSSVPKGNARTVDDIISQGPGLIKKFNKYSADSATLNAYRTVYPEEFDKLIAWRDNGKREWVENLLQSTSESASSKVLKDNLAIIPVGNHLGDFVQAGEYLTRGLKNYDIAGKRLVKIALKPGAEDLIFHSDYLALQPGGKKITLEFAHKDLPYVKSSLNEGALPGYLGIKSESDQYFSLSLAGDYKSPGPSQLLFQLFVKDVEDVTLESLLWQYRDSTKTFKKLLKSLPEAYQDAETLASAVKTMELEKYYPEYLSGLKGG